jgi:hypothetical protein
MLTPKIDLTGFNGACTVVTSKPAIDGFLLDGGSLLDECAKESNHGPS